MKKQLLILLLVCEFGFSQANLLHDINQGNGSSSPSNKIVFNGEAYFAAFTEMSGIELWKTDGTELGTVMVKDIIPGEDSGFTSELKGHVVNGELYFFEQTSFNEHNLWKTDGTEIGTVLVKDVPAGNLLVHTDLNNELLFSVGANLWKSNGTESGTTIITNKAIFGNRFVKHNGHVYYSGYGTTSQGNELIKSDGTAVGTTLVKDIRPGSSNSFPTNFGVANGVVFFTANDGVNGSELWKTDGTEVGTVMLKNMTPGSGNTFTFENPIASFNNEYFISANTKLYKSDGTELGTVEVKDVGFVKGLKVFSSKLFAFNYNTTFWESDGTTAGTNEVVTECDEFFHFGASQQAVIGNEYYFQGRDECFYQLWKTDGTAQGTVRVKVILPVWDDGHIQNIVDLNGDAILTANDGTWHGNELWKSDGSDIGTYMIKDIYNEGNTASSPLEFFDYNGIVLFSADNGENGRELWKKEGGSVSMVKDINPGNLFGDPKEFIEFNGEVYFKAFTKTHGTELWKTDGTESGTIRITDINPDEESGLLPNGNIVALNNKLYFYADNGAEGAELWESDGTNGGTMQVKDINNGIGNSANTGILFLFNNAIYFAAHNGSLDFELWTSDGTNAGTSLLKDIYASGSANPSNFIEFNSKLYFTANTASGGRLYMSDGSEPGTTIVSSSASYPSNMVASGSHLFFKSGSDLWKTDGVSTSALGISGYPNSLTDHNGTLYFSTNVGGLGYELWKTDGVNYSIVKDIIPGSNQSSNINEIISFGGYLLFGAGDNSQNKELWISDGTETGTNLFQDINPSTEQYGNGSDPKNFFVQGNTLYFSANDGATNIEPWTLNTNTLSVEEVEVSNVGVKLFPNPTDEGFNIVTHNNTLETIEIYSILGEKIVTIKKSNIPIDNWFNISQLKSGIYLVKIKTSHQEKTIKIIKR